ncbi:MAG: DUF4129 domain-containing protein [Halococcoides sp.]
MPDRTRVGDWPPDQMLVVALCVLALLLAAVAAPQPAADEPRVTGPGENGTATADPSPRTVSQGQGNGSAGSNDGGDATGGRVVPTCSIVVPRVVVPGESIEVLVQSPSGPVQGARVFLNGTPVGVTGRSGLVEATVPYERPLTVSAALPSNATCRPPGTVTVEEGVASASGVGTAPIGDHRAIAGLAAHTGPADRATPTNETTVDRTVRVVGSITITIEGRPYPGSPVTVAAAIGDRAVPNATVRVAGERVGRTDASGRARVRLPETGETTTIRVERGDFAVEREIAIAHLRAAITSSQLLALPGDPATIRVRAGEQPVPDATIARNGAVVARADADGRAHVTLPADIWATYRVSGATQTTTVAVWPRYLLTGLVGAIPVLIGVALLGLIGLAVVWGRSSDPAPAPTTPATTAPGRSTHPEYTRDRLREQWRAFARQVTPGEWATTPPAIVAERAIDAGAPAGPVTAFAETFREVEYGDRPLDDDRTRRVREAVESLGVEP